MPTALLTLVKFAAVIISTVFSVAPLAGQTFTGTIKYTIHKNQGDHSFSNPYSSGVDTLVYHFTDSVVVMETRVAEEIAFLGPYPYELIHLPTSTAYTYDQTSKEWKIREYKDSTVRTVMRDSKYGSTRVLNYDCIPFTRKIDDKHISDQDVVDAIAIESSGKAILWAAPQLRISADHPALDFMSVNADGVRYLVLSKRTEVLSNVNSSVFGAIGSAYNFEHNAISMTPQLETKFQDILQLWNSRSKKP
jgi:hypothetical protein